MSTRFAVVAFVDDESGTGCHQVLLSKEKLELVERFVQSLFEGSVPVSKERLPLELGKSQNGVTSE